MRFVGFWWGRCGVEVEFWRGVDQRASGLGERRFGQLWIGDFHPGLDVRFGSFGRCDTSFLILDLSQGRGKLFSQLVFALELFLVSRELLFLLDELGGVAGGAFGEGEVLGLCGVAGVRVVELGLLGAGGDGVALVAGAELLVEVGDSVGEVGGLSVGRGFAGA